MNIVKPVANREGIRPNCRMSVESNAWNHCRQLRQTPDDANNKIHHS